MALIYGWFNKGDKIQIRPAILFLVLFPISGGILVFLHGAFPFSEIWWIDLLFLAIVVSFFWFAFLYEAERIEELPHAFMSYSHARDYQLVIPVRHAIHLTAKPFYEMRARYAIMDRSDLKLQLPSQSKLETALSELVGRAKFFIFLASPAAAESAWVTFEINSFLAKNNIEQLLIVLTDGKIVWNPTKRDFDWSKTSALPLCLSRKFEREPNFVDLRSERRRLIEKRRSDKRLRHLILPLIAAIDQRDLGIIKTLSDRYQRNEKYIIWLSILLISLMVLSLLFVAVRKL